MQIFFLTLIGLAVVRIVLWLIVVPEALLPVANALVGILFLGAPILALFFAARSGWTPRLAAAFVACGFALQFGFAALDYFVLHQRGLGGAVIAAISQIGLPIWSVGLGALLATMVKDKNILIPIAIFLAVFDMFLVLTPEGPTKQVMTAYPKVFEAAAASIPAVQTHYEGARVRSMAHAGPADFVFLSMFFIALYRFGMRIERTLHWMIPVLLGYLLLAGVLGIGLPALVPIGLTVLLVNRREFQMTKDEKLSTLLVAALGVGLLIWGATRPKPPAEPSPRGAVQGSRGSAGSPEPAPEGQSR